MSCSQGVHFQFIGDKVKNYVLPKNKIYVLPKSESYVLAKRKTELQTPIIQGKTERWVIRWTHPLLTISAKTTIGKLKKN